MISLRDELPLIQLQDGLAVTFQQPWLIRSLGRAARQAGYPQWWLAEHVAQGVAEWLRGENDGTVVGVERLARAVRSALEVIGYPEVARHFQAGRPSMLISLVELAREAGAGYELAFFRLLGQRIDDLITSSLQQSCDFELRGLDTSVRLLRGRKVWSRDCDGLRDEIINFARSQTELAAGGNEITFALT